MRYRHIDQLVDGASCFPDRLLGVVLYQMLTGELPHKGTFTAVVSQIVQGQRKPPSELRPGLDKHLELICHKMLANSLDARYSSADEVVASLGRYLARTGTEANPAAPQAAGTQAKLEEQKQQAIELLKKGEFNRAAGRLGKLAGVEGAGAEPYVTWAKDELNRLNGMPKEVRDKGPSLVADAIESLAGQDYPKAIELLGSIPDEYRSPEAAQLFDKASKLKEETDQLNERMAQAVRDRQYDGLRENVLERLLEIEPGNLMARDIFESLGTYGPGDPLKFGKDGMLLPAHGQPTRPDHRGRPLYQPTTTRTTQRRKVSGDTARTTTPAAPASGRGFSIGQVPILPLAIAMGILGIVALGIVFLLRDGRQTVKIEIDQTLVNETNVTVWLDGKEMEISGLGETIKLKPGEHGYEIRRGDEVIAARTFTVLKGDSPALRITVEDDPAVASAKPTTSPAKIAQARSGTGPKRPTPPRKQLGPKPTSMADAGRKPGPTKDRPPGKPTPPNKTAAQKKMPAAEITGEPGRGENALRGIIPRPATLPGIGRWQVETVVPRGGINSLDWSPDGSLIACGTATGYVRIYDAKTLRLVALMRGHPGAVRCIAWSPDGQRLASTGAGDPTIRLWQSDGTPAAVLEGHDSAVLSVVWSPDGLRLASGGWDKEVRLWGADGTPGLVLEGHTDVVRSIAWCPDGLWLASGSNDTTIRLWEADGTPGLQRT